MLRRRLFVLKLNLRRTSALPDLNLGEIKSVFSDREVSKDTSNEEKLILAGQNISEKAGILRKLSNNAFIY